jgi:hypothetical protein
MPLLLLGILKPSLKYVPSSSKQPGLQRKHHKWEEKEEKGSYSACVQCKPLAKIAHHRTISPIMLILHPPPLEPLVRGCGCPLFRKWIDRIRIVERTNGNDNVNEHAKHTFQVVALAVPQEIANHEDGQDQDDGVEDFKVEFHFGANPPADNDDERRIEEGCLDGGAEDVGEGEVHLVVPGFIHGCDVFCCLFNDRDKDEADESAAILV